MYMRRAYDGCPPLATPDNEFYSSGDERYTLEREQEPQHQELPKGESLHMTMNRLIPYFEDVIEPHLKNGKTVLVVTHGSIVRALLKYLFSIGDEEISKINVPNGIPLSIKLNEEGKPVDETWTYLDPERAKVEAEKVARQGFEQQQQELKEKEKKLANGNA
ncbi:unnamed protein product [Ambrosiozyma monospora]|uniref:Unnamed protein product n=1 Tax=Ambrosiozyma monospora TaxID=43982 RepID=A0ACB5T0Q1_AMBMO|nr:unnamed protein product [Ambrosiozyma monospora]